MKINPAPILNIIGFLLVTIGIMILVSSSWSYFDGSDDLMGLWISSGISLFLGILCYLFQREKKTSINRREGYIIVTGGWLAMVVVGSLPYMLTGALPSFTDAFFETMSGITTTGATLFDNIESQPRGLLFWRSLTQWLGGMGIIVLTVAILPLLGVGGAELFVAEAPGPTKDKIHPRIAETAKRLWVIYLSLTLVLIILLFLQGMSLFDAMNHALTTMSTGGFSTKDTSIAAFDSSIHYTIMFFMIIAGINYTVLYFIVKRKFQRVFSSDEWRFYLVFLFLTCIFVSLLLVLNGMAWEPAIRKGGFQVISIITTTGYITDDYGAWGGHLYMFIFLLFFTGACAGSTSGGIKMVRHLVFLKNSFYEFKRILHPRGLIRIRVNNEIVQPRILTHILVFLLVYLITFIAGVVAFSFMGLDFETAAGVSASAIGNIGPAIGDVGPVDTYSGLKTEIKWGLSFLMLLGRLELFSVLVLLTPYFWRFN